MASPDVSHAKHAMFPVQRGPVLLNLRLRGKPVSERETRTVTPATGIAMARVQLLAMVGMGCHYVALGSADGQYPSTCRAATITQALDLESGDVGLCVMNPTGFFFHETVPYDPACAPGTWHWPERV